MSRKNPISELTIKGFKSIRSLDRFDLTNLNVLLGANGAGKSSFVSYFQMLAAMMDGQLKAWTSKQGSADRVLSFGVKETTEISSFIKFGLNGYKFRLHPTSEETFVFDMESLYFNGPRYGVSWIPLGDGYSEARLSQAAARKALDAGYRRDAAEFCFDSISNWKVYHFHDTSETALVKRSSSVENGDELASDAGNLAAFLYRLQTEEHEVYENIRRTIRLAVPYFDDFRLRPRIGKSEDETVRLYWRQLGSNYNFSPSQLSDGSIRFICLVTALLQPSPPSTIIIDEPELGLHPYAITLLGSLLKSASNRMQVIVSTQSVALVNEFSPEDLVIVEREQGDTVFKRLDGDSLESWLEDYSLGELWAKNVLGGRPRS
ncbi:AAA family ATPase [Stenotrophomonas geniculata]|uniref:AAA family ATPase n=1 Tax=Stenotrophomonas geniculata TaxID=86188 RepID=UPI001F5342EB|nr:AAA family ATPase [Stenotrophomonas maltophilia]